MNTSGRTQGWFVLVAGTIGVFLTTPGQTVGVSGFVDHVAADLGMPRSQVVMLYSVGTLLGILPAPLIGRLVDRYGPRRAIAFIAPALGFACATVAWAHGPWSLALGFTLLRGGAIGGLYLVSLNLVNLWFDRLRGRATAIAMLGLALGGLVIPGSAEQITAAYGWRISYIALGAAVVVIMLPVGLMCFRNRPEAYGLTADFGKVLPAKATGNREDRTLGEAIRTRVFWYLLSISVLANAIGTALLLDHVRALQLAGVARTSAIGLLGVVTTAQAVCVLSGGVLVDTYGTRRVGLLGLMLLALAVACVMAAPSFLAGSVYAAALGAGLGVLHVVQGAGLAEHFGIRHLGTLRGTTSVFGIFGAATGPLLFAWWSPETGYGMMIGPAQVAARVLEASALSRFHPLLSTRLACITHPIGACVIGIFGGGAAAAFALLHGAGNGILTIARGTLPLATSARKTTPIGSARPHRCSFADLPSACAAGLRTVNRTDGTWRRGDFIALQPGRVGGIASATPCRSPQRPSRVASAVTRLRKQLPGAWVVAGPLTGKRVSRPAWARACAWLPAPAIRRKAESPRSKGGIDKIGRLDTHVSGWPRQGSIPVPLPPPSTEQSAIELGRPAPKSPAK